ncbi:hypothetical protein L3514_21995 [Klebsiella aerogenes]|uniref:hypothetical protein n=1 Tax=Klebsiella aerogenes TaxID=548 RepID=UPI001866C8CC|nr:hypothetical protein [Klebsiella aerogenes]MDG0008040.1 hypothetical protein [Klebsiella aerogenes]HDU2905259.1 hypothetical protein [Klebsiella aerogenes]
MRKLLLFIFFLTAFSAVGESQNKVEKSIEAFCSDNAKPDSGDVCKSYLKMMITFSHQVGYASAACDLGHTKSVDCKDIRTSESEIDSLQNK